MMEPQLALRPAAGGDSGAHGSGGGATQPASQMPPIQGSSSWVRAMQPGSVRLRSMEATTTGERKREREEHEVQVGAFGGQQHEEHMTWYREEEGGGVERHMQQHEAFGGALSGTMIGVGETGDAEGEWGEMMGEMGADVMTGREVEGVGTMQEDVARASAKGAGQEGEKPGGEGQEIGLPSSPVLMFGDVQYDDTSPMSAALMKRASPAP